MTVYFPEIHRIHTGRVIDPTDPHPTPPGRHEIDRAAAVVIHHVAEQCHAADRLPARRNPSLIYGLVLVDLGGPDLNFRTLADLVADWPPAGEFPTHDAADLYDWRVHDMLRNHNYGGTQ